MSVARRGVASAVLNGKLYAIGGNGLSSVEVYDPSTNIVNRISIQVSYIWEQQLVLTE